MARKRRISFAASAVEDLEAIRAWHAGQRVPKVGERLVGEVLAQIEQLADLPERGRVVPEFGLEHLREVIHPAFRIVYRLDDDRVRVVLVWRSERLFEVPRGLPGVEYRCDGECPTVSRDGAASAVPSGRTSPAAAPDSTPSPGSR